MKFMNPKWVVIVDNNMAMIIKYFRQSVTQRHLIFKLSRLLHGMFRKHSHVLLTQTIVTMVLNASWLPNKLFSFSFKCLLDSHVVDVSRKH